MILLQTMNTFLSLPVAKRLDCNYRRDVEVRIPHVIPRGFGDFSQSPSLPSKRHAKVTLNVTHRGRYKLISSPHCGEDIGGGRIP
jgi:hypothetical protein